LASQGGEAEKVKMWRIRFGILFFLLVLILLLASFVFGVLTYWLGAESPPSSEPTGSGQHEAQLVCSTGLLGPDGRSISGQANGSYPRNPFVEETKGLLVKVGG